MTEITYTRQGDYNLPNLLPPQRSRFPMGNTHCFGRSSSRSTAG